MKDRRIVLSVVFIALWLDTMIMTMVTPIIPEYLVKSARGANESTGAFGNSTVNTIFANQNIRVTLLFASKAVVQLFTNLVAGPITNNIGYSIPVFLGFIILLGSTLTFAFAKSYPLLFIARAIQGIGSSFTSVGGMGMLAEHYPDDKERGQAMGIALGGLGLGAVMGPPFGGVMYHFFGKTTPFLVIAGFIVLDGLIQLVLLQPRLTKNDVQGPPMIRLLSDPYILLCLAALSLGIMCLGFVEPTLPLYMIEDLKSKVWEIGIIFVPATVAYLLSINVFGYLSALMGRWLCCLLGDVLMGISIITITFPRNMYELIPTMIGIGLASGMIESSIFPHMGFLVDIRHVGIYGNVYALGNLAICFSFAVGPLIAGPIIKAGGFSIACYVFGGQAIAIAPFLIYLRNPEKRENAEEKKGGGKYQSLE